jgi:predicted  nucleic acid-binding Zn-ribbon protein
MKQKVAKRLPVEMFPRLMPNVEKAQIFMMKLENLRTIHLSKTINRKVKDGRDEELFFKNERELISMQDELPAWQNYRNSLPEGHEKIKDTDHKIYTITRKIEDLEEKMEKEGGFEAAEDVFDYTAHEEYVESADALAEEIGKWFSSGVIGKGTIQYNGRTFTAE